MARNKYPEQTISKILDISYTLFLRNGYDDTSIQNIVDAIGMSKGAIYHHFKSKEAILEALAENMFRMRYDDLLSLPKDLNGLEKLRYYLKTEFQNNDKQDLDYIMKPLIQNPRFFSIMVQGIQENAQYILPLIEEGILDSSIQVEDAQMVTEFILLICNIWVNPLLWVNYDENQYYRKILVFKTALEGLGVPVIDDELLGILKIYYHSIQPR